MTTRTSEEGLNRILVAVDTSACGRAALEAAARLAAELNAELVALFVEDANLLRLAGLPFACELLAGGPVAKRIDSRGMERALKAEAEQIRRAIATAATPLRVRWSLRVARGRVDSEVLAAAEEADLLVMGTAGRALGRRATVGSTARALAERSSRSVLFLAPGHTVGRPVVTLFHGSGTSLRALDLAAAFAREDHQNLLVLLPPANPESALRLGGQASERLARRGLRPRIIELPSLDPHILVQAVQAHGGRLLVLAADAAPCRPESLESLLQRTTCPVVVAR